MALGVLRATSHLKPPAAHTWLLQTPLDSSNTFLVLPRRSQVTGDD